MNRGEEAPSTPVAKLGSEFKTAAGDVDDEEAARLANYIEKSPANVGAMPTTEVSLQIVCLFLYLMMIKTKNK